MASIEESLRAALVADGTVAALIGTRCYANRIPPHDSPTPWAFIRIAGEDPSELIYENSAYRADVEVELFADTYAECRELKAAVRAVLNRYRGGLVQRCMWDGSDSVDVEGGHNITERYSVWTDGIDVGESALVWGPQTLVWGA